MQQVVGDRQQLHKDEQAVAESPAPPLMERFNNQAYYGMTIIDTSIVCFDLHVNTSTSYTIVVFSETH